LRRGRFTLIDLFSGAGGFARGFEEAGFESLLGIDADRAAARSYAGNFPYSAVLAEDIRGVSCDDVRYLIGSDSVDVVIGSPPCEPFTGANPRRRPDPLDRLYADPQGALVLEFIRLAACLSPKVYVMENVPAITEGPLKAAVRKEFESAGLGRPYFNVLRAHEHGTPSRRVRVFVSNVLLRPRRSRAPTVWEAIGDLPEPSDDPIIPNHDPPPPLSKSKLRRVSRLRWGQAMIRYEGFGGRLLPNMIRLDPRKIAPTVLGSSRFIHPFENRLLTVREQARLMGFPDDHVFVGGRDEQYNQVGEAVPVPLAKAIAEYIITLLV